MKFFLVFFSALLFHSAFAQTNTIPVTWDQLAAVRFEDAYDNSSGTFYKKPIFSPSVKALEGKRIAIAGYTIPIDAGLRSFVLSANTFSACFFCGAAGPESVIDLLFSQDTQRYKTDQRATFCGNLVLIQNTLYQLPYALDQAEECNGN